MTAEFMTAEPVLRSDAPPANGPDMVDGDDDLYEARLLGFARFAETVPPPGPAMAAATRLSRVCGSRITVGISRDGEGRIAGYGHAFRSACTLSRAAAGVLAAAIVGRRPESVAAALVALDRVLARQGDASALAAAWPDLDVLAPVADMPTRHESVRLPFRAALDALSDPPSNSG